MSSLFSAGDFSEGSLCSPGFVSGLGTLAFSSFGLAAFLLWLHQRSARQVEWLLLSSEAIRVVRIDPAGRKRETRLATGWLRVELEERPGRVPGLLLHAPGRRVEVAAALGDAAKRDLAQAVADAVRDARHPRFDNPQLRQVEPLRV